MLRPTPEQEKLFWQFAGAARWAYNYHIRRNQEEYAKGNKYISAYTMMKEITQLKKTEEYAWLNNISSSVIRMGIIDADNAFKSFFKKQSGYPKFKSRKRNRPSFYVRYDRLTKKDSGFRGEKLGIVKTKQSLPNIPKGEYYINPHISYDGKYWYLTVGYEVPEEKVELTNEVIGIDLGIKNLATCSNNKTYKNINKSKRVNQIKKSLKENNISYLVK